MPQHWDFREYDPCIGGRLGEGFQVLTLSDSIGQLRVPTQTYKHTKGSMIFFFQLENNVNFLQGNYYRNSYIS